MYLEILHTARKRIDEYTGTLDFAYWVVGIVIVVSVVLFVLMLATWFGWIHSLSWQAGTLIFSGWIAILVAATYYAMGEKTPR